MGSSFQVKIRRLELLSAAIDMIAFADFGLVPANAFGSCLGLWYTLSIFGSCKDQRIKVLIERGLVTGVAVPSVLASILAFGVEVGALSLALSASVLTVLSLSSFQDAAARNVVMGVFANCESSVRYTASRWRF